MEVSGIRVCTVGVRDLEASLGLFRDVMKLQVEDRGELPRALAAAWHLPEGTRGTFAELSCAGYPLGRLRLIQYEPSSGVYVRRDSHREDGDSPTDIGPKAIDFYVADPIAPRVAEIERAGYLFRSRPVRHQVGDTESEECVFSGPDGVPILIMVGHRHSEAELRPGCLSGPYSDIATVSVVSGNLEESREFYERVLGLVPLVDAETGSAYRASVNNLTGVPAQTRIYFCLYAQRNEPSGKILLVHFFERTGVRLKDRMRPGHLGFSLMTHAVDDLDELHRRLASGGYRIITAPITVESWRGPQRLMLAVGPNEELFEFIEGDGE